MLTLKKLKAMKPHEVIARGIVENSPAGIFMTRNGGMLRWVAVRGYIHDWGIYCHWEASSEAYVKSNGDKVHMEEHIKKLVPCSKLAFEMYRH